jgi:hypothetical protein
MSGCRLDRYISSNFPPKATSVIQHLHFNIFESTTLNHKLLSGLPILWYTRLTLICEFMGIRISSLEERCKGSCEAVVDQRLGLLGSTFYCQLAEHILKIAQEEG